jgi:ABC-2 type transport system permease protein
MITTARYELRMMLRKRSMWITMGIIVVLAGLISVEDVGRGIREDGAKDVVADAALLMNLLLPVGYGCLLADRLIRDRKLGVEPILDATPASPLARLFGKYLGVCAAAAVPIAVVYFGFAAVYAVAVGGPAALGWALATFVAVLLPAVLFVGAWALAVPLLIPAPLFRVLFIAYWFWGNAISPAAMPTLAQTLVTPIGDYPLTGFFGYRGGDGSGAGPEPGASLNFLRPEPTPATAWLSIGILLAIAALVLYGAAAVRARSHR